MQWYQLDLSHYNNFYLKTVVNIDLLQLFAIRNLQKKDFQFLQFRFRKTYITEKNEELLSYVSDRRTVQYQDMIRKVNFCGNYKE